MSGSVQQDPPPPHRSSYIKSRTQNFAIVVPFGCRGATGAAMAAAGGTGAAMAADGGLADGWLADWQAGWLEVTNSPLSGAACWFGREAAGGRLSFICRLIRARAIGITSIVY